MASNTKIALSVFITVGKTAGQQIEEKYVADCYNNKILQIGHPGYNYRNKLEVTSSWLTACLNFLFLKEYLDPVINLIMKTE